MGKKIAFVFLLFVQILELYAQNAALNHSKYWFYRTRLRNEFMAVGEPGQCGAPSGMNIPASSAYEDIGDIHFGDGTSHLGNFMAVLATEYQLLKRSPNYTQQELNTILKELYWCLKTYERLDLQAEVLYTPKSGSCSNGLNGFFCRDDISDDVVMKLGNPYDEVPLIGPEKKTIASSYYKEAANVPLSYLDNVDVNNETKEPFPSTDQMSNLLVGFAFVKKIFNGVSYNGEDLGGLAGYYTSKIMDYYSNTGWDLEIPNTPATPSIENPRAKHTISKYGGLQSIVVGYGLGKAGENIFGGHWGNSSFTSGRWGGSAPQVAIDVWNCLNIPIGVKQYVNNYQSGNSYNNAVTSQLAAIGNSWEYGLIPIKRKVGCINIPCTAIYWDNCRTACLYCTKWFGCNCRTVCGPRFASWDCGQSECIYVWSYDVQLPTCLEGLASTLSPIISGFANLGPVPFPLPKISVNTTNLALAEYGYRTHTEIFSMEHRFLHGNKQYYGTNAINEYLNTAPCTGPHSNPVHDPHNPNPSLSPGVYGWETDNRFEKSRAESHVNNVGGWNGIDYMLLHNLYYSLHGSAEEVNGFFNEMNYNLTNASFPRSASPNGSTASPLTLNGFETLTASSTTVNSGADLKLHAGKCVKMNNGFKAASGAKFKAYVQYTFPCDVNNGYNGVQQTNPVLPRVDTPMDSAQTVAQIKADIAKLKRPSDSLAPIVYAKKAAEGYQPLSEFVQTPVHRESVPTSRILSVYPNPIPIKTELTARVFLVNAERIKFYLVNNMGSAASPWVYQYLPSGESAIKMQFDNDLPGVYSLILEGTNFRSHYNIILQ